jgi:hypothetical protein
LLRERFLWIDARKGLTNALAWGKKDRTKNNPVVSKGFIAEEFEYDEANEGMRSALIQVQRAIITS